LPQITPAKLISSATSSTGFVARDESRTATRLSHFHGDEASQITLGALMSSAMGLGVVSL